MLYAGILIAVLDRGLTRSYIPVVRYRVGLSRLPYLHAHVLHKIDSDTTTPDSTDGSYNTLRLRLDER